MSQAMQEPEEPKEPPGTLIVAGKKTIEKLLITKDEEVRQVQVIYIRSNYQLFFPFF